VHTASWHVEFPSWHVGDSLKRVFVAGKIVARWTPNVARL